MILGKHPYFKGLQISLVIILGLSLASCGREAPTYEPGTIRVQSDQPEARIFMDGQDTGEIGSFTFVDLDPNVTYDISMHLDEYISTPDSVLVPLIPLDFIVLNFSLSKTALVITSEPAGAAIFFDGEDTGRVTPATIANLDEGPIEVSLRLDSFSVLPTSFTAIVEKDKVVTLPSDTFALTPLALQRTVILEGFANVNCGPCPELTDNLVAMATNPEFSTDKVLYLEFSVSWPNSQDPLYLYNAPENKEKYEEYLVFGAPALYTNGVQLDDALDVSAMEASIVAAWETDPGFLIHVDANMTNPTVLVDVTLEPFADLDLNGHSLYVALYEKTVTFATAPGTNGQTIFHHVFRDRVDNLPSLGTLTTGTDIMINASVARGSLLPENLVVVAFVQRDSDHAIIQAGSYGAEAKARGNQ